MHQRMLVEVASHEQQQLHEPGALFEALLVHQMVAAAVRTADEVVALDEVLQWKRGFLQKLLREALQVLL